ncbi:YicC/YloC family endoribonuclease [Rhodopirellula sp. MGV]|uniref:YicC/YloC family endoribonuclease n=1 Tax=Rhodopirellula sp. MGV TaxID=2023130 RepID=UPI000B96AAE7|nr:YicC/YloC family endoribonuclease [Rhodopirellula sp. MGV]OYP38269.1 YicC family protein [Rhodopirellula sp. MGV]PNY38607.1 YicC family protein [Rhodopirellula baltica]
MTTAPAAKAAEGPTAKDLDCETTGSSRAYAVCSMTGQGRGTGDSTLGTLTVELRAVNHRGFKCSLRTPEAISPLESRIESELRRHLHRGAINVNVSVERHGGQTPVQINPAVLADYLRQCQQAITDSGIAGEHVTISAASLVSLPGVLTGDQGSSDDDQLWKQVSVVVTAAAANLIEMRQTEGQAMAETLIADCQTIRKHVDSIAKLAPQVADNYRGRLETKVNRLLAEFDAEVGPTDLLREVQVFADRTDISEEITRLGSHLTLFEAVMCGENENAKSGSAKSAAGREEPAGRRLDFITQEMFRETNTIGSKANHAAISALVVEIKCAIERMRELVQNLE